MKQLVFKGMLWGGACPCIKAQYYKINITNVMHDDGMTSQGVLVIYELADTY